jgi:glycosyltransferase involved in cell wall biosynthesis
MSDSSKYIIITPVRDEGPYIEKTISSVINQTILPSEWVIVDDGSTDGTSEILDRYQDQFAWIKVIHRKNRGHRASGGGVIEAFYDGYSVHTAKEWDYIVKLDGDLSFNPSYFEKCFAHFESDPKLGLAGGTVLVFEKGQLKVDALGDPQFHVRGATKIYRRSCWEKICPLVKAPGWDTIDEIKANYYNWTTRTFPDLELIQHKFTGGADGKWRNWFKNGRANYITGYHPAFMLAKCIKRAFGKTIIVESLALFAGFISGYLKGIPQALDEDTRNYLRRQQIQRLLMKHSIYCQRPSPEREELL